MLNNIFFGLALTLIFYMLSNYLQNKTKSPLANPLIIGTGGIIVILLGFDIPIENYFKGASILETFLVLGTVSLAIPLYKNFDTLKANSLPIIGGALVGSIVSLGSVIILGKLLNIDIKLIESIMPKSITMGMAVPLVEELSGITSLTAFSIIITGMSGAVLGPSVLKIIGIDDPIAFGVAMGVTSHVSGTAKAMEIGEEEGTIAGLCIVLAGLITIFIFPLAIKLI